MGPHSWGSAIAQAQTCSPPSQALFLHPVPTAPQDHPRRPGSWGQGASPKTAAEPRVLGCFAAGRVRCSLLSCGSVWPLPSHAGSQWVAGSLPLVVESPCFRAPKCFFGAEGLTRDTGSLGTGEGNDGGQTLQARSHPGKGLPGRPAGVPGHPDSRGRCVSV